MSDDARDRLDLLVDTDPLRLRDEAYSLLARAEQAEAERDALAAQVAAMTGMLERMPDEHMRFHLLQPDGTHTELPCADWCYACKLQTAVERAEQAEATVREQVAAEIETLRQRLLNQPAPQRPRAIDALWEAAKIARGGR